MKLWMRQAVGVVAMLFVFMASADELSVPPATHSGSEPTLVERVTDSVVSGAESVGEASVSASRSAVEKTGHWVDQGQQSAGQTWSKTREVSGEIANRSVRGVSVGVDYVRDGTGRLIDKSVAVGDAAWQTTKEVSAETWNRGKTVARSVKEEVVGTDGPVADVIDKSTPVQP